MQRAVGGLGQPLPNLLSLWDQIWLSLWGLRGPFPSPVSPSTVGFFQLMMKIPLPLQTQPRPHALGGIWG